MKLHLLNRPPSGGLAASQALSAMAEEDALLLLEDGVYAVLDAAWPGHRLGNGRLYVVKEDLEARGLGAQVCDTASVIDMAAFVDLTAKAEQTISWY